MKDRVVGEILQRSGEIAESERSVRSPDLLNVWVFGRDVLLFNCLIATLVRRPAGRRGEQRIEGIQATRLGGNL
jgi:hypothetical protein